MPDIWYLGRSQLADKVKTCSVLDPLPCDSVVTQFSYK